MILTKKERVTLAGTFALLKGQRLMMEKAGVDEPNGEFDIPSENECRIAIEILRCGYASLYDEHVFKWRGKGFAEEMSPDEEEFVMDVFHMYDDISRYMEGHPEDKEVCEHEYSKFQGFDGNNDWRCYAFARFWTKTLEWHSDLVAKRKEELKDEVRKDPFNSHSVITRQIYEAMLEVWREIRPLKSREQVMAILEAPIVRQE